MIAALVLVALVAAGQAQAMPERFDSQEVQQPYYELAGMRELACILKHLPQVSALLRESAPHFQELAMAAADLGQQLVPCLSAEDQLECATRVVNEFVEGDLDANVRDFVNKLVAINQSINQCAGYGRRL